MFKCFGCFMAKTVPEVLGWGINGRINSFLGNYPQPHIQRAPFKGASVRSDITLKKCLIMKTLNHLFIKWISLQLIETLELMGVAL